MDSVGEIVLIELKFSESFRVTDLQALAYAGAYATQDPSQLAETLRWYLSRLGRFSCLALQPTSMPIARGRIHASPTRRLEARATAFAGDLSEPAPGIEPRTS